MAVHSGTYAALFPSRLRRFGSWRPGRKYVLVAFCVGFVLSWVTLWFGLAQHGAEPIMSPLYGFLLFFVEASRDLLNQFIWLRPTFSPPSLVSLPVLLACAIAGEIFATAMALARAERGIIRWGGFLLLFVLVLAALSWSAIPPLPKA